MAIELEPGAAYREVWESLPDYANHSPGEQWAAKFAEMTGAEAGDSVLDAGCGTGKGGIALRQLGFRVSFADVTSAGLQDDLMRDFVPVNFWDGPVRTPHVHLFCCDVLEHIPTEYVMLTVRHMLESVTRTAFFSISLVHDRFGIWVGRPLHETVREFTWWRDRLSRVPGWRMRECRDCLNTGLFALERK